MVPILNINCTLLIILVAGFLFSCEKKGSQPNGNIKESYFQAYQLMQTNPIEALVWSDKNISQALAMGDRAQISRAYHLRAYIYDQQLHDPENAVSSYIRILNYASLPDDTETYFNTINNIGELYYRYAFYRTSIDVFSEGLLTARKLNDRPRINKFNHSLVAAYFKLEAWSVAEKYIKQGLDLSQKIKDTLSWINYATMEAALRTNNNQFQKAVTRLQSILTRNYEIPKLQKQRILNNLGYNYLQLNQLDKAEYCFQGSLLLSEDNEKTSRITLNNLASLAVKTNDFRKAEELFLEAETLPVTKPGDEDQLETYEGLVQVYTSLSIPDLAMKYKQKSVEHVLPIVSEIEKFRSFSTRFEDWRKSKDIIESKNTVDRRMAFISVVSIFVLVIPVMTLIVVILYYKKLKRESELKVLREINEFKDAIIANIRLLF